jgi:uncharacterized protein (TIGR02284 family)
MAMVQAKDDVALLNDLIATLIDSADGYEQAAEVTDQQNLKSEFLNLASQRRRIIEEFRGQVRRLGGTPEDDGTLLAAAHRQFLNLRSAFQSGAKAALGEVERGEDHIKNKFESALANTQAGAQTLAFVRDTWAKIKGDHDRMKRLRDSMAA